jgi:hypothetical protein
MIARVIHNSGACFSSAGAEIPNGFFAQSTYPLIPGELYEIYGILSTNEVAYYCIHFIDTLWLAPSLLFELADTELGEGWKFSLKIINKKQVIFMGVGKISSDNNILSRLLAAEQVGLDEIL